MSQSKDEHDRETKPTLDAVENDGGEVVDLTAWIDRNQPRAKAQANLVSIDEKRLAQLVKRSIMLAAMVRPEGRVRIRRSDLDKVTNRCKLDVKVQENGDLVLTFVER